MNATEAILTLGVGSLMRRMKKMSKIRQEEADAVADA
jgi:hypothetical protein